VAIEESREIIADFINAHPNEIYFTSGGTEANNFIIEGISKTEFKESGRNNILTSTGEHNAVLNKIRNLENEGFETSFINVNKTFHPIFEEIKNFSNKKSLLCSFISVNNETGSITYLKNITAFLNNVYFHTDAVQSFGKFKIDVKKLGIHALSASAHKIYGPKGIGLAYVKSQTPMNSLIVGGGQERNRRAGTENVAAIVGFAEAVKLANQNLEENFKIVASLKNYFWKGLIENNINEILNNSEFESSPYILSVTLNPEFYKNDSEAILMFLDINGIAVSSGSACASGTLKPSHVILAGGYSKEYANGTIRFSFSPENTFEELNYTVEVVKNLTEKFRK
jgi:cysteine desulfurase